MAGAVSYRRRPCGKAGGRSTIGAPALSVSDADAARIVAEACRPPSDVGIPITHWSARTLGSHLRSEDVAVSDRTVSRILRQADLQPHRQQMWLTSQDEEFREKRDDVLRLYYEPPRDHHVLCLDEKTGMQALERRYPDLPMVPGRPVRREFEYIRHGTLCLMGGYNVRQRKLFGVRDWLEDHPRWTLHFTPKHASWLNQIECAFSILHRHVLSRGSFRSLEELKQQVEAYILWFNQRLAPPFDWSYRPKSWD